MNQIVECVPNFSEGRDAAVIDAIVQAIRDVPGARCISAEPNADYHRCVVTLIGAPAAVVEGAFAATVRATSLIDMRLHKGNHPRLGATDVVPFVPVHGVTMHDCVGLAETYGRRVAEQLQLPVFLYESAARVPERKNLAAIRKGEYEGLEAKLKDPVWAPDFGPAVFNAQSGAVITGARTFLIAYNVNLATDNLQVANDIAATLRESGRVAKDASGNPAVGPDGKKIVVPGLLKSVKAMGVLLDERKITQVSMNLVDFTITPPHVAYEAVKAEAARRGVTVTGSEIVGLVPKDALIAAGLFYGQRGMEESRLIDQAVQGLGLSDLDPFLPGEKVIEFQL